LAAQQGRILVTHDRRTMTLHAQGESAVGDVIEFLILVWSSSEAEEWRDRVVYL